MKNQRNTFQYITVIKNTFTATKLKLFILSIGIFLSTFSLFSAQSVLADSFYPDGNVDDCNFAIATSVSYKSLPNNCSTNSCLAFNNGDVYGESGSYPENHVFTNVADITYPDAHRYRGVADRIGVPPNTQVDVGFFVYNYAGHSITPLSAYLFVLIFEVGVHFGNWNINIANY